jgi:hypothetical protein
MDSLERLLSNPAGLAAVACLVVVVVIANLALVALIRGGEVNLDRMRRALNREAELWRRSFSAGPEAQRRQADQMDELHRLVSTLKEDSDDTK